MKFDKTEWDRMLSEQDENTVRSWFQVFRDKITDEEYAAIYRYTGSSYYEINRYLRGMEDSISKYKSIAIDDCTSALKKASIPKDTIVRRGVDDDALNAMLMDNRAFDNIIANKGAEKYVGAIFADKGFVSTSPLPKGGFGGEVEMVIKLPKGSQAAYVDPMSANRGEKELLIQRSQMYQVEHLEAFVSPAGRDKVRMYCNLIGGFIE